MWDTIKHERFKDVLTLFCIYVIHRAISCCEQLVCVEKDTVLQSKSGLRLRNGQFWRIQRCKLEFYFDADL